MQCANKLQNFLLQNFMNAHI